MGAHIAWVPMPPPIPTHYVLWNYENHIPLLVIVTVTLYVTSGKDNGMEDIYFSEMGKILLLFRHRVIFWRLSEL